MKKLLGIVVLGLLLSGNAAYANAKFYNKYFKKFMKTPEAELCISYINAYGWHKTEKKQAIKFEVLETRDINCDSSVIHFSVLA
jgi:hypothetical protein